MCKWPTGFVSQLDPSCPYFPTNFQETYICMISQLQALQDERRHSMFMYNPSVKEGLLLSWMCSVYNNSRSLRRRNRLWCPAGRDRVALTTAPLHKRSTMHTWIRCPESLISRCSLILAPRALLMCLSTHQWSDRREPRSALECSDTCTIGEDETGRC